MLKDRRTIRDIFLAALTSKKQHVDFDCFFQSVRLLDQFRRTIPAVVQHVVSRDKFSRLA
jgi:hypothetical protein